jgi:hypothetical protein
MHITTIKQRFVYELENPNNTSMGKTTPGQLNPVNHYVIEI